MNFLCRIIGHNYSKRVKFSESMQSDKKCICSRCGKFSGGIIGKVVSTERTKCGGLKITGRILI